MKINNDFNPAQGYNNYNMNPRFVADVDGDGNN